MSLLELREVHGGYGGADILHGVSMHVDAGEIVVIVGPNGAGKSTAMKAVFGLVRISAGEVCLEGREITGTPADKVVKRSVGFVPQNDNVFPNLSVDENLDMGAFLRRDGYERTRRDLFELFPPLRERRKQRAGTLSGGQRQMVAMGRALMLEPKLLLLDEPTAGLSPKYVHQIFRIVSAIKTRGIGVVMVEQNARRALAIADRGYVLATGRNRYHDSGRNLLANPEVAQMFLGG